MNNHLDDNNYVDLMALKAERILQSRSFGLKLSDDIWENKRLLLSGGRYLTEDLINKLLNFGVQKVSVDIVEKEADESSKEDFFKKEYIECQKVLILENNLLDASWFVRHLVDIGFSKGNIFLTSNHNSINKYFRIKKLNYIFASMSLYEKCIKTLNKYSLLKDVHVFVKLGQDDTLKKLRTNYQSGVKFLNMPLHTKPFEKEVNNAINSNLIDYYTAEYGAS